MFIAPPPLYPKKEKKISLLNRIFYQVISLKDNDSLAALLAVELKADLLILLSDVNGIYTGPPDQPESTLIQTFHPDKFKDIQFGTKSRVGRGGMESKVRSSVWALERGTSVVIANGTGQDYHIIGDIINGRNVGTFFTTAEQFGPSVEDQASKGIYM